jgi:YHS domain-containing protein
MRSSRKRATWVLGLTIAAVTVIAGMGGLQAADTKAEFKGDPYTLDTCVVMGKKLGSMGDPVVKTYDGREVRFCCESCVPKFEAEPAKYLKRLDEELISQQTPHYPLKNCVVMEDDPLEGGHEESAQLVYRNRLVKFCCEGCVEEFNADPAKYIAKLDKAVIEQQSKVYPLTECAVSGNPMSGKTPYEHVIGVTLVKLCCKGCLAKLQKDPLPALKKVHDAWAAAHKDGGHDQPAKP